MNTKAKAPTFAESLARTKPAKAAKPEKIFNAGATKKRQGKRGFTVYLDPVAHAQLKELAADEEKTLEEMAIEGLNYLFANRGRSPIA